MLAALKGTGFSEGYGLYRLRKNSCFEKVLKGHGFIRAVTAIESTRASQAAEKLAECLSTSGFVTGHDLSRAANAIKSMWPLGPANLRSSSTMFFRSLFSP
jgi:hypothetical protein